MWKRLAGGKQHPNKLSLRGSLAHHRISPKGQQPTSGRSSRVGVTQIGWSPILIDAGTGISTGTWHW
jgi:hypothetical protein